MKKIAVFSAALMMSAGVAAACPWSGGTYSGDDKNRGLQITFVVNQDCTRMSFQSSGNAGFQPVDTPQPFDLTKRHKHWEADINGARATFSKDGKWVEFFANGNNLRVFVFK